MVLVFLCLGGWLPSHHRRDTCNHGAAPMETRWTWLRAADTQAVRESRSWAERAVCHAPPPRYLIMQAGDYLNTALVFSGIIMIAILGLALDACLRGLLLLADPIRRR